MKAGDRITRAEALDAAEEIVGRVLCRYHDDRGIIDQDDIRDRLRAAFAPAPASEPDCDCCEYWSDGTPDEWDGRPGDPDSTPIAPGEPAGCVILRDGGKCLKEAPAPEPEAEEAEMCYCKEYSFGGEYGKCGHCGSPLVVNATSPSRPAQPEPVAYLAQPQYGTAEVFLLESCAELHAGYGGKVRPLVYADDSRGGAEAGRRLAEDVVRRWVCNDGRLSASKQAILDEARAYLAGIPPVPAAGKFFCTEAQVDVARELAHRLMEEDQPDPDAITFTVRPGANITEEQRKSLPSIAAILGFSFARFAETPPAPEAVNPLPEDSCPRCDNPWIIHDCPVDHSKDVCPGGTPPSPERVAALEECARRVLQGIDWKAAEKGALRCGMPLADNWAKREEQAVYSWRGSGGRRGCCYSQADILLHHPLPAGRRQVDAYDETGHRLYTQAEMEDAHDRGVEETASAWQRKTEEAVAAAHQNGLELGHLEEARSAAADYHAMIGRETGVGVESDTETTGAHTRRAVAQAVAAAREEGLRDGRVAGRSQATRETWTALGEVFPGVLPDDPDAGVKPFLLKVLALRQAAPASAVRDLEEGLQPNAYEIDSVWYWNLQTECDGNKSPTMEEALDSAEQALAAVRAASPPPALSAEAMAVVEAAVAWYRNSWAVSNGYFRKLVGELLAVDPDGKWREGLRVEREPVGRVKIEIDGTHITTEYDFLPSESGTYEVCRLADAGEAEEGGE